MAHQALLDEMPCAAAATHFDASSISGNYALVAVSRCFQRFDDKAFSLECADIRTGPAPTSRLLSLDTFTRFNMPLFRLHLLIFQQFQFLPDSHGRTLL